MRLHLIGLATATSALLGGCATVSVYEAATFTEVKLTAPQSALHKASDDFCDTARDAGWASGESNFAKLAKMFGSDEQETPAYWKKLKRNKPTSGQVAERISLDARLAADSLANVNELARVLIHSTTASRPPSKSDIVDFERVLIHAGQARDAFSFAWDKGVSINDLHGAASKDLAIRALDDELNIARKLADQLAAARMVQAMSALEEAAS